MRRCLLVAALLLLCHAEAPAQQPGYDMVLAGGRVMDPESGLDAIRWVGIRDGRIAAISDRPLNGLKTIDASGLVVAPGFIDLHAHGQDNENYRAFALDGVTTALELEVGTGNVAAWYAEREGRALINYGASASHIQSRMRVFDERSGFLPIGDGGRASATPAQIEAIKAGVRQGLDQGGLGIGMGLQYTPGASRWEVLEIFRIAAERQVPVFVHNRAFGQQEPGGAVEAFLEVIGAAALTGAPLHIVHLNSMSLGSTPRTLRMVADAQARGLDVTTEAYPYSAGATAIESALLDQYENAPDSVYHLMQWAQTGERLTRETFAKYRKEGGGVILHLNTPEMEAMAITSPLTAIASDGGLQNGKGHPRSTGTYARVLGHYVRETGAITLMDAIRKSTLMPALRLEAMAPMFRDKGRIRVGADADITVFDPATVTDHSTYQSPALPSTGFRFVLVNGAAVVQDGALVDGVFPGRAARAATR